MELHIGAMVCNKCFSTLWLLIPARAPPLLLLLPAQAGASGAGGGGEERHGEDTRVDSPTTEL